MERKGRRLQIYLHFSRETEDMLEKYSGCSLDFYRQFHGEERRNGLHSANESVRAGGRVTDVVLDE